MNRSFRFCLSASQSPTHYNLSRYLQEQNWRQSRFNWRADFSDKNLQFDSQAAEQLEYKHLLAELVGYYCPEVMPKTYCINDQNWPQVLDQLAANYYWINNQLVNQINHLVWILKPALLNNGEAIKIFEKLSDLEAHFLNPARLGGEHVLQRYLIEPHLLRGGRKYSIRMFVIITNYAGSFLYPYGYYNVALRPFAANDFQDLRPHLTNEHLQEDEANVLQIPTQRFTAFKAQYPQIKAILIAVIRGLEEAHPQAFICRKNHRLAIYGFDFLVDKGGRLWLLEANHGPCFPTSDDHPLQGYLYSNFWQAFIHRFVLPIALNQAESTRDYHPFESLGA